MHFRSKGSPATSTTVKSKTSTASAKPFNCDLCKYRCIKKRGLQRHQSVVHGVRHPCPFCERIYVSEIQLQIHMVTHTKEKPFQCMQCTRTFSSKGSLQHHTKNNPCPNKDKVRKVPKLVYRRTVQRTEGDVNNDLKSKDSFSCDLCDKHFPREFGLRVHQRTHGIKVVSEYSCSYCLRIFSSSSALSRHSVTHTGVKAFQCRTCERSFTRKDILQNHTRLGTCGVKKPIIPSQIEEAETFSCTVCHRPRTFPTRAGLRIHNWKVHGVVGGPYICLFCDDGKHWPSNGHLQIHMVTHTKEKHFQCPLCQKLFGTKVGMTSHMNRKSCLSSAGLSEPKLTEIRICSSPKPKANNVAETETLIKNISKPAAKKYVNEPIAT